MKKQFFTLLMLVGFFITSCGDDSKCVKCEIEFFGTITTEACEDGSDLKVTTTAFGISADTIFKNQTLSAFQADQESQGATCK